MEFNADRLIVIARSLGFSRLGIVNLDSAESLSGVVDMMRVWLEKGYAGDMRYLARHLAIRANPKALLARPTPTLRAIVVAMDYLPKETDATAWRPAEEAALGDPARAVISVYARGRDYHRVMRSRLVRLARTLKDQCRPTQGAPSAYQFRACVDSAPVLEVELARKAQLGWRGKHTLLLNREQGSMFFLGVLLTDMPLAEMPPETTEISAMNGAVRAPDLPSAPINTGHCGTCTACLDACPTSAFTAPYELDARRCISYLTIEHEGAIAEELRPLLGNRVYGCDDCQRVCPWNRYAKPALIDDFDVRHGLDESTLLGLFSWTEKEFSERHRGSAILRIGYGRWRRNLAVGLGNALRSASLPGHLRTEIGKALRAALPGAPEALAEHIRWALRAGEPHEFA